MTCCSKGVSPGDFQENTGYVRKKCLDKDLSGRSGK